VPDGPYTGTATLDALDGATNYRSWLAGFVDELGRRAATTALVDFGAGIGTYPREARSRGYQVTCVELDDAQRDRLVADGFSAVRSLDALGDGAVSAVYSLNVIEHIADDAHALRQLLRVVRPGGGLLLVVPAFPVLFSNLDRQVGHFRRYRRRGLVRTVAGAGWVVDSCRYGDSLGFPAALVYRLLGRVVDGILKPGQVGVYDRALFPLSRRLDAVTHRWVGKNLILFAHRPDAAQSAA
jgi:SAM-dependent methyltransferase